VRSKTQKGPWIGGGNRRLGRTGREFEEARMPRDSTDGVSTPPLYLSLYPSAGGGRQEGGGNGAWTGE